MVAHHPLVAALAREVQLGAAFLEDVEEQAPSGPVWGAADRGRAPPVDRSVTTPTVRVYPGRSEVRLVVGWL
jgi:hypothetical protein